MAGISYSLELFKFEQSSSFVAMLDVYISASLSKNLATPQYLYFDSKLLISVSFVASSWYTLDLFASDPFTIMLSKGGFLWKL